MTNHLLSVDSSGGDVTAIGCMYTYNAASPHGDDEYEAQAVPPGAPEAGIIAFKVTLSAPSESSGPDGPQQGPSRAPSDNVFGGYKVTGYFGGYFSAEGADPVWPENVPVNRRLHRQGAGSPRAAEVSVHELPVAQRICDPARRARVAGQTR